MKKGDLIVDCSRDELITRQEFKGEVDVNTILSRHGVGNFMARPEVFGEHDFDLDLQTAIAVTDEARAMWQRLPMEIRVKYGSLEEVRAAMDRGELVPPQPAAAAGGSSPAAGAGSPSDSAADGDRK